MTKLELTQRLNVAINENIALGARVLQLQTQLVAERGTRASSPHATYAARATFAKAEAVRTGKCVSV